MVKKIRISWQYNTLITTDTHSGYYWLPWLITIIIENLRLPICVALRLNCVHTCWKFSSLSHCTHRFMHACVSSIPMGFSVSRIYDEIYAFIIPVVTTTIICVSVFAFHPPLHYYFDLRVHFETSGNKSFHFLKFYYYIFWSYNSIQFTIKYNFSFEIWRGCLTIWNFCIMIVIYTNFISLEKNLKKKLPESNT